MAAANGSLQPTHQPNQSLISVDSKSLILSQFAIDRQPNLLQLTTHSFTMERGPRYKAYAELRESKLRTKNTKPQSQEEEESNPSPPTKQVKFQASFQATPPPNRRKGPSVLAQSVPDFSAVLRKENRKPPVNTLPPVREKSLTPPLSGLKNSKFSGVGERSGGSKSANVGEKKTGGLTARKSYASMEELKGLSAAAASAINGENRGGRRNGRGVAKTVLGYRQYY
ncbi:hypothetical protein U1Q18_038747 [Sarracenia purpurea var. burkii]